MEKLGAIGRFLQSRNDVAVIEAIGSWPVIDAGMPGRTSMDLDVWLPGSQFDQSALREACLAAEMGFDPIGEADTPYIQLVRPGIVHVPPHTAEYGSTYGSLTVNVPPAAALIASKLVRAAAKDIEDSLFLQNKFSISAADVANCANQITNPLARETATENVVYLRISGATPSA